MDKQNFDLQAFIDRSNSGTDMVPAKTHRTPRQIEHSIQVACVRWFRYQYQDLSPLFFAVPNGGARSQATGAKMKAEGVLAGVSDLVLLLPRHGYHGLLIEMKTSERGSRQADSQKRFQSATTAQGYRYIVCRSTDDFIQQVTDYVEE